MLVSVGDRVRPGLYRMHSRFDRAANYTNGEDLVSVVRKELGPGPLNIVFDVNEAGAAGLPAGEALEAGENWLASGGQRWEVSESLRYRSGLEARGAGLGARGSGLEARARATALEARLTAVAPPGSVAAMLSVAGEGRQRGAFERALQARFRETAECLRAGDLAGCVTRVKGCGIGLTPSGDDFNAGLLLALSVLDDTRASLPNLLALALGGNPLSNAFLRMAAEGRMTPRQRGLIEAVAGSPAGEPDAALAAILEVGATSGADFATGFLMTFSCRAGADGAGQGAEPWQ